MYICRWLVLCETVVADRSSNNLTMVNAVTEFYVPEFPALYPRFAFASLLETQEQSEGPLSLRFIREKESGDETLLTIPGKEKVNKPAKIQFYVNFPAGIRLFGEGKITFRVEAREGEIDWYHVASQNVQVHLARPRKEESVNEGIENT